MEDWYAVEIAEVRKYGGETLLQRYGNSRLSLIAALSTVYPGIQNRSIEAHQTTFGIRGK